jgi:DNA topoisomerase III, bacteria and conjugative plasmid
MKSLVLAEKPSVAREIARVLGCSIKGKGYLEGPRYVVSWALGHLVTLAEPEDYDKKYKSWNIADLPMLPQDMKLKVIRQTFHQFQAVKDLMKRNDINELIIATDAGREGELVARWIMEAAHWKKPFRRLWISSQTDTAIKEGFKNLKPGISYNNLYDAALCRAEADWLIGLNVTRALTCRFNAQLSAGRVQTPTLAMIIERENEIKNFKPVDYWTINADFGGYFGEWRDKNGNSRLFSLEKAEEIVQKAKGQKGTVTDVRVEEKSELPPLAYDLTELQRDANRRYGWSAQKTLSVLQNLYEVHKIVTYPRTDSRYISSDIVPTLPDRLKGMAAGSYEGFAKNLLSKKITTTKRLVDNSKVSDHHAIIPTEQRLKLEDLNADEKKLYDLIARRFLSVLYPPCRYEQVTVITTVSGENFHSRGKSVKDPGWKAVSGSYAKPDSEEDGPEQNLPAEKKGSVKNIISCRSVKSKTKPPARYTEATLLTAMECAGKFIEDEELRESIKQGGLGTPATRADIIEKIVYANYIERHGKELVPTSKGIQLISLVPSNLRSPELTARWEQYLSEIASGRGSRKKFMEGIRENTVELVEGVAEDTSTYRADNVTKTKCPMCGKYMLLINTRHGKMLSCPDRACGYRQMERQNDSDIFKTSRNEQRVNQKLISKFSDKESVGNSLGDLLKQAMLKQDNDQ